MTTGDASDFLARLKSLIPGGWFNLVAPIRDAVLGGVSDDLAAQYNLLQAVKATTRINTATGWILDLVVWDFFGPAFVRRDKEADDAFRARFIRELFQERVTKAGISQVLQDLTGRAPRLFEAFSPGDCGGGYGVGQIAYGTVGAYGSLLYPDQIFVTAYRPTTGGIPNIAGYSLGQGGYGVVGSNSAYATIKQTVSTVSDDEIYAVIAGTAAAGVTPWVHIRS